MELYSTVALGPAPNDGRAPSFISLVGGSSPRGNGSNGTGSLVSTPTGRVVRRAQIADTDAETLVLFNTRDSSAREVWGVLNQCLDAELLAAIVSVKQVTYRSSQPCMHLRVKRDLASSLIRVIRSSTKK